MPHVATSLFRRRLLLRCHAPLTSLICRFAAVITLITLDAADAIYAMLMPPSRCRRARRAERRWRQFYAFAADAMMLRFISMPPFSYGADCRRRAMLDDAPLPAFRAVERCAFAATAFFISPLRRYAAELSLSYAITPWLRCCRALRRCRRPLFAIIESMPPPPLMLTLPCRRRRRRWRRLLIRYWLRAMPMLLRLFDAIWLRVIVCTPYALHMLTPTRVAEMSRAPYYADFVTPCRHTLYSAPLPLRHIYAPRAMFCHAYLRYDAASIFALFYAFAHFSLACYATFQKMTRTLSDDGAACRFAVMVAAIYYAATHC